MRISPRPRTAVLVFLGNLPNAILALVLVLVLIRREKGQRLPQVGVTVPDPLPAT